MATMNVSLPVDIVDFVENEVSEGGYASSNEVIRDALRLLQHDKALEREKLIILRREIDMGLEEAQAGHFSTQTVSEIADESRREYSGE
jgi:antitoxin ParD1/3/4